MRHWMIIDRKYNNIRHRHNDNRVWYCSLRRQLRRRRQQQRFTPQTMHQLWSNIVIQLRQMKYTTHRQNNYNKQLKGREVCCTFNTSTCVVSEQESRPSYWLCNMGTAPTTVGKKIYHRNSRFILSSAISRYLF